MLNIASTRPASLCKVVKQLARIVPAFSARHLKERKRVHGIQTSLHVCLYKSNLAVPVQQALCEAKHPYAKCIGDSIRLDAANGLKYAWKMSHFFTAQSSEGINSPVVVPVTVTVANLP